jgi:hypothetical protein
MDPSRSVTTLKTAWNGVRKTAEVKGRWHDARHTLFTELAESGAGDETIMAIAGHVSRQMLKRYSHIRTIRTRWINYIRLVRNTCNLCKMSWELYGKRDMASPESRSLQLDFRHLDIVSTSVEVRTGTAQRRSTRCTYRRKVQTA